MKLKLTEKYSVFELVILAISGILSIMFITLLILLIINPVYVFLPPFNLIVGVLSLAGLILVPFCRVKSTKKWIKNFLAAISSMCIALILFTFFGLIALSLQSI